MTFKIIKKNKFTFKKVVERFGNRIRITIFKAMSRKDTYGITWQVCGQKIV